MDDRTPFFGLRGIKELAESWNVSPRTLYYIVNKHGVAPTKTLGNQKLFSPQEQEDIFRVIRQYASKVGTDIELTLALTDLEVEQCEMETRQKTWSMHMLQRLERDVKELREHRNGLEARLEAMEAKNPFVLLLRALQSFGATDLTPAALDQWALILRGLPPGGYGGSLVVLTTLMGRSLNEALHAVNDGSLAAQDLPQLVDVMRVLVQDLTPFVSRNLDDLQRALDAQIPDEATNLDGPF